MATDCVALPARLKTLLTALRDARAVRLAAQEPHDEAEMRHLLTASIVAAQERDLSEVPEAERVRAQVHAERERVAFVEKRRALEEARLIADLIQERLLEAAAPYLPANDASFEAAE